MAQSKRLAAYQAKLNGSTAPVPGEEENELVPPVEEEEEEEDPENPTVPTGKDASMTDITQAAVDTARAEGVAEGIKAVTERFAKVSASEHFTGREAYACKLLGMGMNDEQILAILPDYPKAVAAEEAPELSAEDKEEAERQAMQEAIRAGGGTGTVDANGGAAAPGGGQPESKAKKILAAQQAYTGRTSKALAKA